MNARISALISRFKRIRLIEVAIAIAIIIGVIVAVRMTGVYKEGLENNIPNSTIPISSHADNIIKNIQHSNPSIPIQVAANPSTPIQVVANSPTLIQ